MSMKFLINILETQRNTTSKVPSSTATTTEGNNLLASYVSFKVYKNLVNVSTKYLKSFLVTFLVSNILFKCYNLVDLW